MPARPYRPCNRIRPASDHCRTACLKRPSRRPQLARYLSCSSALASGGAAATPEALSSERAIQPLQTPRQRFHLVFTTVHNGVSLQHAATFLSSTSADLKRHRQAWRRGATARHGQELGHKTHPSRSSHACPIRPMPLGPTVSPCTRVQSLPPCGHPRSANL